MIKVCSYFPEEWTAAHIRAARRMLVETSDVTDRKILFEIYRSYLGEHKSVDEAKELVKGVGD